MKKLYTLCRIAYLICLFTMPALFSQAQNEAPRHFSIGDMAEKLWQEKGSAWEQSLAQKLDARPADFRLFLEYNQPVLFKDRGDFFHGLMNGDLMAEGIDDFFVKLTAKYLHLYDEFFIIQTNTPGVIQSTIEGRKTPSGARGVCHPACSNTSFGNGTLSFWDSYWAVHGSSSTAIVMNYVTGGPSGSVTQDAYDPNTSSYQISLMNTTGVDPIAGALIPLTPPLGGLAARVGDGVISNYGAGILEQTFNVSASNPILTIQYAVVLENPRHTGYQQPWFKIEVLDQNDSIIPGCGQYFVVSGSGIPGFVPIVRYSGGDTVYCKPWATAFVPLQDYIGQCVKVRYTSADCAQGGHFGYAYVAASCNRIGLTSSSAVYCSGQQSATVTGPPGAGSYQWTTPDGCITGATNQRLITITCGGTYKLVTTATAGAQCVDSFSITIPQSSAGPPPTPCFTWDTACSGTPTSFNASCSNPNSGGKFYWDFFTSGHYQDSSGTTPQWTFNAGGNFNVRLHQVTPDGCAADTTISVHVIQSNGYAAPQTIVTPTNATACTSCNGRLSFRVVLPPGATSGFKFTTSCNPTVFTVSPPNNYSFSAGNLFTDYTFNIFSNPLIITLNNICPGNCFVYIAPLDTTPPNRCSPAKFVGDTIIAFVPVTGVNIIASQTVTPATCGASNGSATVDASGGTAPYTYTWSNGLGTGPTKTGLAGGTYTVTVQDASSCGLVATVTVGGNSQLVVNATPYFVTCNGSNNGKIKLNVVGSSGPLTYVWSPNVSTVDSAIGLAPGAYSVTVSESGGCSGTATANIQQPTAITTTFSGGYTGVPCFGTGSATANPSGGFPPYTYLWQSGRTAATDTGLAVGKHVVTVTDAGGCSKADTVTVVGTASLTITANPGTNICLGDSVELTCAGGSNFQWSTTANTAMIKVAPTQNTTYTVTASNTCGSATASAAIVVNSLPVASVTPANSTVCPGQSTTLRASGGVSYSWAGGGSADSLTVNPTQPTTYTVTVTNANQCKSTASAQVNISASTDTAKVTVVPSNTSACIGSAISFTATPTNGGSTPVYQWKVNGNDVGTNSNTFSSSSLNDQDVVTCVVTSNLPCVVGSPATSNSVTMNILPLVEAGSITAVPDSICLGSSAQLTVTGNTSVVSWQSSVTTSAYTNISGASGTSYTASPTETTYYRVYGSNGYCSDTSAVFKLFVKPLPAAPALTAADTIICSGESTEICAPDTFVNYSWNNGGASNCTEATFAGGYWVSVTAANGCSVISQRKNISFYPVPSVSIIRQGDTLSSFGAVSYQWYLNGNKISGATSAVYIAKQQGSYSVEITDANGCTALSSPVVITGINDFAPDGSLEIYPNPASDNLQIKTSKQWIGQEYVLYDVIGQIMERGYIGSELTSVPIAQWPSGLYFVKSNSIVIRFMKQ